MFKVMLNKGFHITLPNGVTISTQFGYYDNCNCYTLWNPEFVDKDYDSSTEEKVHSCANAEVAIWHLGKELMKDFPYSDGCGVASNVTPEQWLEILDFARNLPEEKQ